MTPRVLPVLVLIALLTSVAGYALADGAIESGDRLRIVVLGANDLCGDVSVSADGNINMPLVGAFKVAGKTTAETATELKSVLKKWVKEPDVTVEVIQKAPSMVVLSGRVKKPGAYTIGTNTTLLELIGLAGGADTNADLDAVSLVHEGSQSAETINLQSFIDGKELKANPQLAAGDIVMVPEKVSTVGTVFVLGEVKRLGGLELRQGMRIHEAVGEAGGVTELADPQTATLKNKNGEITKFDLVKALAQDPAEDKVLASGDTIYIQPTSGTINIYGAVNKPDSYPIKQSMPLTDALAMAGGYAPNAHIQDVQILRSSQQKSITVNLAAVQQNKAENIAVLPGDTIVVGQRGQKTSIWQVMSAIGTLGWLVW